MRLTLIVIGFFSISTLAFAQSDSITVERERGLEGLWRISVPSSIGVGLGGPATWGAMTSIFCRLSEAQRVHCLSGGYARDGSASLDGKQFRLSWGSMMARFAIDGAYASTGLSGTFSLSAMGIRHYAPTLSTGARVRGTEVPDDAEAAYLSGLLNELARGKLAAAHDVRAISSNDGELPKGLAAMGKIEAVAFLGDTPKMAGQHDNFYRAYYVGFERGELVCGLHRRSDGVLDGFKCV